MRQLTSPMTHGGWDWCGPGTGRFDIVFPRISCGYLSLDTEDQSGMPQAGVVSQVVRLRLDLQGRPVGGLQVMVRAVRDRGMLLVTRRGFTLWAGSKGPYGWASESTVFSGSVSGSEHAGADDKT